MNTIYDPRRLLIVHVVLTGESDSDWMHALHTLKANESINN